MHQQRKPGDTFRKLKYDNVKEHSQPLEQKKPRPIVCSCRYRPCFRKGVHPNAVPRRGALASHRGSDLVGHDALPVVAVDGPQHLPGGGRHLVAAPQQRPPRHRLALHLHERVGLATRPPVGRATHSTAHAHQGRPGNQTSSD